MDLKKGEDTLNWATRRNRRNGTDWRTKWFQDCNRRRLLCWSDRKTEPTRSVLELQAFGDNCWARRRVRMRLVPLVSRFRYCGVFADPHPNTLTLRQSLVLIRMAPKVVWKWSPDDELSICTTLSRIRLLCCEMCWLFFWDEIKVTKWLTSLEA